MTNLIAKTSDDDGFDALAHSGRAIGHAGRGAEIGDLDSVHHGSIEKTVTAVATIVERSRRRQGPWMFGASNQVALDSLGVPISSSADHRSPATSAFKDSR